MMSTTLPVGAGLLSACGWSLVSFLWQGTLLAAALAAALKISRRDSANLRYVICCAALGIMALSPVLTGASLQFRRSVPPPVQELGSVADGSGLVAQEGHIQVQHYFADLINWTDSHMAAIVILWFVGVLLALARVLGSIAAVERLKAAALRAAPDDLQFSARQLASRLKLSPLPRLTISEEVSAPVVAGWRTPAVLLPASSLSRLAPQQAEGILAHEFAHVRRRDYLVNLLQAVVEALLFYHPAVWWASRQIRREREHCCDDLALRMSGSALAYAKALTALEERRFPAIFEPSLGAYGGDLSMRIKRLLEHKPTLPFARGRSISLASLGAFTAVALLLLSIAAADRVSAQTGQAKAATQQQSQTKHPANQQKPPDMSCTYYDNKNQAHGGVCEASTLEKDVEVYLCRRTDLPAPPKTPPPSNGNPASIVGGKTLDQLTQPQTGCEWKVKRFREWQRQQRQSK